MASLSFYPHEINLISNRNVIKLLLQLKSAKAHGKNYIKAKVDLITLYNVCSVHWEMFSTSGGYHEYIGGIP